MSRKKQQNIPLTQTKKSPKILGYSFSKDVSKAAPKEPSLTSDVLRDDWIPFGENNLFPQEQHSV